jgi:hypothetical protein
MSSAALPLPTTISVHQSPSPRSQRSSDLFRASLFSETRASEGFQSTSESEQESNTAAVVDKKRSLAHHTCIIAMDQNFQPHDAPPPTKLRRLVASYWKQPDSPRASSAHGASGQSAPGRVTPNWEQITQGPPASGSYDYDEHYYGSRKVRKESPMDVSPPSHRCRQEYFDVDPSTSPTSDTLPRNFGHFRSDAMTMIHKPKAAPFIKLESPREHGSHSNMDAFCSTPSARYAKDGDDMSLTDDSHQLFETVKQAVVQFSYGRTNNLSFDNEDDDEELTGFLKQAAAAAVAMGPDGRGSTTTTMTMIGEDNVDAAMFQPVTPSPDPIHQATVDRKLPPILPPLHRRDAMHGTGRTVHLSQKKASGAHYPPSSFFSTGSSSWGSIPREIIAPVIYPEVVVASHGARGDPMDPRFGIEHPPSGAAPPW